MISIDAVERGLACDCFCPQCDVSLVAVKGDVNRHHFRHYSETCREARETALHLFAKQVICDCKELALPNPLGKMIKATPEYHLGGAIADVYSEYKTDTVAVEIWVAHQVPEQKIKFYNDCKQAALEIDLHRYRLTSHSEIDWQKLVIFDAPRMWLSPPLEIRKRDEARRKQLLKEQRERIAAEKAERDRLEKERVAAEKEHQRLIAERVAFVEQQQAKEAERLATFAAAQQEARLKAEQMRLAEAKARHAEYERLRVMETRLRREMRGPDLQEMIEAHSGYHCITPEAWLAFDAEITQWRRRLQCGDFRQWPYSKLTRLDFLARPSEQCYAGDALQGQIQNPFER